MMLKTAAIVLALAAGLAAQKPEATFLLGKPLVSPEPPADAKARMEQDLADAHAALTRATASPDALIWVGRRQAYLGRYREAIATFTGGVKQILAPFGVIAAAAEPARVSRR